jgi:DNA replicative helicase MCM subunit Mcm2 (Cdc46/Mcm family)
MKFKCQKCGHECEVDANSREFHRNNITCPKCHGTGIKPSISGKPAADTHSLLKYRYRQR